MPTASCAGVQISVGLPATAGGAVTTAFTSGAVLSTTAGVVIVSTLPALSVTTAEMVTAPSGGCPLPVAVFHARANPPAATVTAAPMLCAPPVVPVQRHCTLRMPEVPSTASVVSATAAPVTAVPAAGVTTVPRGRVLSTTTVVVAVAVCPALSVTTLQMSYVPSAIVVVSRVAAIAPAAQLPTAPTCRTLERTPDPVSALVPLMVTTPRRKFGAPSGVAATVPVGANVSTVT